MNFLPLLLASVLCITIALRLSYLSFSFVKHLENTEPQLLRNSHLGTAHYLLQTFLSTVISQPNILRPTCDTNSKPANTISSQAIPNHLLNQAQNMMPFQQILPIQPPPLPPTIAPSTGPSTTHLQMFKPFVPLPTGPPVENLIDFKTTSLSDFEFLEILGTCVLIF